MQPFWRPSLRHVVRFRRYADDDWCADAAPRAACIGAIQARGARGSSRRVPARPRGRAARHALPGSQAAALRAHINWLIIDAIDA